MEAMRDAWTDDRMEDLAARGRALRMAVEPVIRHYLMTLVGLLTAHF